jgi:predicted nucleic acid-binding protein
MNVVDSSGWLEYLADGAHADFFAAAIEDPAALVVPTISMYEVFKRVLQQRGEGDALRAVALMAQGKVVELDMRTALEAAALSQAEKLPLADSIIWATARLYDATLWTQDSDFEALDGVQYIAKPE